MKNMTGRAAPSKPSNLHAAVLVEAKRQKITGYALQKATALPLSTIQRFLAAEVSPTVATVEAVAKALGLAIKVEKIP